MNRGKLLEAWRRKRGGLRGGRGGGDFVAVSNEDRLGARGVAGLLPIGDANALSLAAVQERIPGAGSVPVIAGVCATDPLRLMDKFLVEMKSAGASGIQNRPSVGMIDGGFRANLEEAKLGYALEVEMIREAVSLDLLTLALVFRPEDARAMAEAGADGVVIHPGVELRPWGSWAEAVAAAAREARRDVLILAWGAGGDGIDGIQID